ncbi:Myosin-crossreactive antigen [Labilithrix luteola]|uniref:Myosin-crossreactive antigen n=1 Tax=Labilithrix luteola TaxID=1391654 RepID=A0A0K1Q3T6_9BACT|nr:oleate hydratase [Labilithrix luteola]AKV00413.1 Myosin-crossreactive antigen [Labilithrix luteola]
MVNAQNARVWLVGGGIASLAAAAFLVRDAGVRGQNIRILEHLPMPGGSLDGADSPLVKDAYVSRGGRMLEEEAYVCLWNLLDSIPTLGDSTKSVKEEIWAFNHVNKTNARARIVRGDHTIADASELGLDGRDRADMVRLLMMSEKAIGDRRIYEFFKPHFFQTNFWCMWRTTFAFQNWHSAIELRRYFLRFVQEFDRIHTLSGVRRTRLNQYDSIVRPIEQWLEQRGVATEYGVTVTDVDFRGPDARRAERLRLIRHGKPETIELGAEDFVFLTLGSMTADSTYGGDHTVPELVTDKRDGSWSLWDRLATKAADFGHPSVFHGNVGESKWESFTLTMKGPLLLDRIRDFSGNVPGEGALITFKDSRWLLSIVVPHQPHFDGQPDDVFTLWGYSLLGDNLGDYVNKRMSECTGQEVLTELLGHLGAEDIADEVRKTTKVTTVMMPYITAQFERRAPGDRPLVVPKGAENFAFLGQFVEIPEDVVFTVEYSVRGAMHAVYRHFDVHQKVPGIYHGVIHPRVALSALKTAFAYCGDHLLGPRISGPTVGEGPEILGPLHKSVANSV